MGRPRPRHTIEGVRPSDDLPTPIAELVRSLEAGGHWVGLNEQRQAFPTFGTVTAIDLWAVLAEYVPGESPEVGLHARWIMYPDTGWQFIEAQAYRAAMTTPGDLVDPDPPKRYADVAHISKANLYRIAKARTQGEVIKRWLEVTHIV